MSDALQPTCPHCGTLRAPVPMDWGGGVQRAYRCPDCGGSWAVEGRQESLDLQLDGEVMQLPLD